VPDDPYRAPRPIAADDAYLAGWAKLRRRRLALRFVFWATLFSMPVTLYCLNRRLPGDEALLGCAAAASPWVLVLACERWLSAFPCPHCGTKNAWARRITCCRCHLPVGTAKSSLSAAFACPGCGVRMISLWGDPPMRRCPYCKIPFDAATESTIARAEKTPRAEGA
jgi:hypothetical protein